MIYSLRFRFLLAFTLIILVTIGTVFFFINLANQANIRQFHELTRIRTNNIAAGLDLDTSTESTIIDNDINYNGEDGIEWEITIEDPDEEFFNTLIAENTIIDNGGNGIFIKINDEDSASGASLNFQWNNISRNIINENTENGLAIEALNDEYHAFYYNNTFSNNNLSENGENGIYINVWADSCDINFSDNNITDNTIIDSGSDGIFFEEGASENGKAKFFDNIIKGNNITLSGDNGLLVDLYVEDLDQYFNTEASFNYNYLADNIFNKNKDM